MALTQKEELELQQLEKEFGDVGTTPSGNLLSPEEEDELSLLEAEFSEKPTDKIEIAESKQSTLGGRLQERGGAIAEEVEKGISEAPSSLKIPGLTIGGLPIPASVFRARQRVTGQVAGGLGDIIGEGIKRVGGAITPQSVKDFATDVGSGVRFIMSSPDEQLAPGEVVTKRGIEALQDGFEAYQGFKSEFPEVAKDIEAAINTASFLPVGKVSKGVAKETFDIAGDITDATTKKSISQLDRQISKSVNNRLPKATLPKTIGRKTPTQIRSYQVKSRDAVENIIANKESLRFIDDTGQEIVGRLPQNLDEFGQSITQTKAKIFNDFDTLVKMADKDGATIDASKISKELFDIADDSRIQRLTPSTEKEARRLAESYANIAKFSPLEAEKELEVLNRTLKAFYDSPSPDSASVAYVHALVANNIRKQLDNTISNATGKQFQELKNSYGSLRSIEEDVGSAIFREAKKGNPGLVVDFGNVLSSTAALQGILTSNPKLAVAAGAGKIVVDTFKKMREPSRMVNKMFGEVDSVITKRDNLGFNPRSKLGSHLKGRITKAQREGFLAEEGRSVSELGQVKPPVSERGFELVPSQTSPLKPQVPKRPSQRGAVSIEPKTPLSKLTGDPFIDSKLDIALSTPPALRTVEQKFIIDLVTRR